MKYKHYSPKGQTFILKGDVADVSDFLKKRAKFNPVAVLIFDEFKEYMPCEVKTLSLGSKDCPEDAAQRLFDCLRECDTLGVKEIYAPEIPEDGLWRAVRNRLYKAASARIFDVKKAKSVIFVCTGNTCRSPIAEGLLNFSGKNAIAISAGLFVTEDTAEDNAIKTAAELGADIKNHTPRQITAELLESADLVLTMTKSQKYSLPDIENIYTLAELAGENADVADPYGGDIDVYRKCGKQIKNLIEKVEL